MITARSLVTGVVLGAIIALLVRELNQFGLAFAQWSFTGPRAGEALVTGALISAVSPLFGQARGRR